MQEQEQERTFIRFAEENHPLFQEMPKEFRDIWFHSYENPDSEHLFLQMERIFKNPKTQKGGFLDLLTFEIADMEALLEWEEDFPGQKFVAADPYYIFFDGFDEEKRALFSLGDLDLNTMDFTPELEIYISIAKEGIIIDFDEEEEALLWKKLD